MLVLVMAAGLAAGIEVNAQEVDPFTPGGPHRFHRPFTFAPPEAEGSGVGKVVHLSRLPMNLQLAADYNVETPKNFGADWQLRFQFQFLFPKSLL